MIAVIFEEYEAHASSSLFYNKNYIKLQQKLAVLH